MFNFCRTFSLAILASILSFLLNTQDNAVITAAAIQAGIEQNKVFYTHKDMALHGAKSEHYHCLKAIDFYEQKYGLPRNLLYAVSLVESGKFNKEMRLNLPSPWTLNVAGKSYYFSNKQAALAQLRKSISEGYSSIDVGCAQINLQVHGHHFKHPENLLNPVYNIAYAAHYLASNYAETKNWEKAVARYHSRNVELGSKYLRKFRSVIKVIEGDSRYLHEIRMAAEPNKRNSLLSRLLLRNKKPHDDNLLAFNRGWPENIRAKAREPKNISNISFSELDKSKNGLIPAIQQHNKKSPLLVNLANVGATQHLYREYMQVPNNNTNSPLESARLVSKITSASNADSANSRKIGAVKKQEDSGAIGTHSGYKNAKNSTNTSNSKSGLATPKASLVVSYMPQSQARLLENDVANSAEKLEFTPIDKNIYAHNVSLKREEGKILNAAETVPSEQKFNVKSALTGLSQLNKPVDEKSEMTLRRNLTNANHDGAETRKDSKAPLSLILGMFSEPSPASGSQAEIQNTPIKNVQIHTAMDNAPTMSLSESGRKAVGIDEIVNKARMTELESVNNYEYSKRDAAARTTQKTEKTDLIVENSLKNGGISQQSVTYQDLIAGEAQMLASREPLFEEANNSFLANYSFTEIPHIKKIDAELGSINTHSQTEKLLPKNAR